MTPETINTAGMDSVQIVAALVKIADDESCATTIANLTQVQALATAAVISKGDDPDHDKILDLITARPDIEALLSC